MPDGYRVAYISYLELGDKKHTKILKLSDNNRKEKHGSITFYFQQAKFNS